MLKFRVFVPTITKTSGYGEKVGTTNEEYVVFSDKKCDYSNEFISIKIGETEAVINRADLVKILRTISDL